MGSGSSAAGKKQSGSTAPEPSEEELRVVAEKMKLLQKEIKEMMWERERESREYEKEAMALALKEAEWKQERKRLREEVRSLRKLVEGKEERLRGMEQLKIKTLIAHEERAWRDEALDKWKKLYLSIKKELDDLIHRTHQQGGVYCVEEEEVGIEELKRELEEKEGAIKALKMQLASAEYEGYKSKREADILRQSLRIMSNNKKAITPNHTANRKW